MIGVSWTGGVYSMSSTTGTGAFVGASGYASVNSMAKSPSGALYAMSGFGVSNSLITINPVTGAGTLVAVTTINSARGIAFDAAGTLYAVNDSSGTGIGLDDLYTINTTTGVATLIGSTGYFGVQGLAYAGGTLYGWELGSGTGIGVGLITINPATGAASDVNGAVGNDGVIQTLCASPSGALYGVQSSVYSINTVTGSATLVGSGGYSDLRGAEFTGVPTGLQLSKTGSCPGLVTLTVTNATPSGTVAMIYGPAGMFTHTGTPCTGTTVSISAPNLGGFLAADGSGAAALTFNAPAGACGLTVQAVDIGTCGTSNTITL